MHINHTRPNAVGCGFVIDFLKEIVYIPVPGGEECWNFEFETTCRMRM